jgi:hypothetical protein
MRGAGFVIGEHGRVRYSIAEHGAHTNYGLETAVLDLSLTPAFKPVISARSGDKPFRRLELP